MDKKAVIFAASLLIFDESDEKGRVERSKWVADWLKKRNSLGCYATLVPELRAESPELYKNFVRMSAEDFDHLERLVEPLIAKKITYMREPISTGERLAVTLRYLATGESFSSLQYLFRIHQSTISTIVPIVCEAIYTVLYRDYLKCPTSTDEWEKISYLFYDLWNFPNCLGAIDGKHVEIIAPANSGSLYFNYKKSHSIVLMAIADAEYKFTYIDVGVNGRHSDGGVFKNCSFAKAMNYNQLNIPASKELPGRHTKVPYVLVGDDAFAMQKHLLKPYTARNLSVINLSRRIIENVFGIMSAIFRVFRSPILLSPDKACKITKACAALHNFLMIRNRGVYAPNGTFDRYSVNGCIIEGSWRNETQSSSFYGMERSNETTNNDAKVIREEFEQFFIAEGDIPYQYSQI
uniref:CSON015547 protein n=1 Tax=Culicoides sonorensis TaxID=179676 RepID=A0A336KVR8_CULSO